MDALTQRLDRLEREVRCWRLIGAASAVGACLLLLIAASPSTAPVELIRAKRVEVVDDKGRTRIELGSMAESQNSGEMGVVVRGDSGTLAAALMAYGSADQTYARLTLHDRVGRSRAVIQTFSTSDDDWSTLQLFGQYLDKLSDSKERIGLVVGTPDKKIPSTATLTIRSGTAGAELSSNGKAGEIKLNLLNYEGVPPNDALGEGRVALGMTRGSPWLVLGDGRTGYPGLWLGRTQLERPRTGVTEQRPASSAVMFDKDGNVIWKAP